MTAKHRKGKSNHKHEEDHVKSEIPESEVRSGGNNYTLVLFVCLVVVAGVATGAWFCYQQHQTLTHLTDTVTGMQMKVVKLQASQETMRQTSDKVLSLHTEMKSHLAEIQRTAVSVEQLNQLQARLQGKAEEFEGVALQVEGLATSSADLSKRVEAVMGRLEEAEAMLGDVAALSDDVKEQTAQLMGLEVQLKSYQTEMATIRELLPNEGSVQSPKADVEEQISALQMSIREQNSASRSLHAELRTKLDNLQWQVTQMAGDAEAVPEPAKQAEGEPAPVEEEEDAATDEEANLVPAESEEASDDEPYTEQTEQPRNSPETDAPHTEREDEVSDEEDFLEELPLDEGDAQPEKDENDEGIVDAEQVESEEEFDNEVEL
ncbi:uncharacterized protein LOC144013556 isoform X2 [Festucalex cinctus]